MYWPHKLESMVLVDFAPYHALANRVKFVPWFMGVCCVTAAAPKSFVVRMVAPYAANALRSAPTFHAVTRWDNLRGAGSVPRLTMRQTVAAEQPTSAWTTGCRTFAESGSESKFLSASGIVLVSVCCAMSLPFLRRYEHGAFSRLPLRNIEDDIA